MSSPLGTSDYEIVQRSDYGVPAIGDFDLVAVGASWRWAFPYQAPDFGNTLNATPVCFVAGTPILLADGTSKAIDEIEVGEMVLAAADRDPEGPVEARRVVEVYHNRPDQVLRLQVGDLTIRPTLKHPFYVRHKGWTAAGELKVGDELRTHDGRWTQLTATEDQGETEPVYNLHVEAYRTYFVGYEKSCTF